MEARISRALGDLAAAEDTFRAVWYEFDERGMYYELTLVSIDLAEDYAWGLLEQATKTEQFLEIARYFSRSWRMPARFIQPTG